MEQTYEILSIRRARPPLGAEGANWHRYVIAFQGTESIRGYRQGRLDVVANEVEEIVAQLNERHGSKRDRDNLIPTPKKKAY